jgi:transcriptional regulator GlxA family with amidase domain
MRSALLIYPGVEPIDLAPFGVLSMARRLAPRIAVFTVAEEAGVVTLANGLKVVADYGFGDAPAADVLIVAGGPGWQEAARSAATLDFIHRYSAGKTLASVCTGGMILAAAGLLDGRAATTKREVTDAEIAPVVLLRERHPAVRVVDARIVDSGPVLTGGGVTLGIDLTLYLIERFLGAAVARETARILEYSAALAANAARLPTLVEPQEDF